MRHDTPARVAVAYTRCVYISLVQLLQWFTRIRGDVAACSVCTMCTEREKRMNEAKRIRSVSFRLTDEEYGEIEKAAGAAGDEPNNWCRQLALTAAREGPVFGKTGRLIYTELAVLRFLIGNGLRILFSRNEGEAAAWTRYTAQADQKADEIVAELLSRRK